MIPDLTVRLGLRYDQEDVRRLRRPRDLRQSGPSTPAGNVIQAGGQTFELKDEWQSGARRTSNAMKDGSHEGRRLLRALLRALPPDLTIRSYGKNLRGYVQLQHRSLNLVQNQTIGRSPTARAATRTSRSRTT